MVACALACVWCVSVGVCVGGAWGVGRAGEGVCVCLVAVGESGL